MEKIALQQAEDFSGLAESAQLRCALASEAQAILREPRQDVMEMAWDIHHLSELIRNP
jgi:hypothetical protein